MILNKDNRMLRRLVVVCLNNEKIFAHALKRELNVPVEMSIIKEVTNSHEMDEIFNGFAGPFDIILYLMTYESYGVLSTMLTQNENIIKQRALVVIPITISPLKESPVMPFDFFTTLPVISCTGKIQDISERVSKLIKNYLHINLNDVNPLDFENLVKDVLKAYHFKEIMTCYSDHVNFGYDMMCSYLREGDGVKDNWLIEVKRIKEGRFTIRYIDTLIKQSRSHYPTDSKVMLVTNCILTSVIVDYIENLQNEQDMSIYIVDGWKLCNLIALNDNLMKEYFPYE